MPTPPLGEKTEMTLLMCMAPAGPRSATNSWYARPMASVIATVSVWWTTSRAPAFMA